ncbi:MAG: phosphotransferase [Sphingomonas adhaesiva]|uniref:phosphotransferase n=1 Tax=Sphingomonas adhaesiva TaxID=28212 RepID=UPI002FFB7E7C
MTRIAAALPRPDTVTPEWLAARLGPGVTITALAMQPVGTGQLGDTARFTPTYAPGSAPAPATIIGKFAAADPDSRAVAAAWRLYEREVGFYRHLAADAAIATPRCYGAAFDAGTDAFVLLLEDCAPATPGDQFAGVSPDAALRVMREAARLHAAFWDRGDDPALQWLDTGPLAQPFYEAGVLRGAWPAFRDRYADRLTDDMVWVCDGLAERYERYGAPLDRPRCLTHNDYRPDNMLFGADGGVRVVDWQSAALGHNAVDVAYMIGGAFTPPDRRAAEGGLLDTYLDELRRGGVTGYGRAELDEDYRHFSFAGINVAVGAAMMVKRTERGDRMFLTMLDRHVAHVLDTGAMAILQAPPP